MFLFAPFNTVFAASPGMVALNVVKQRESRWRESRCGRLSHA
jgi:hypothetical protein